MRRYESPRSVSGSRVSAKVGNGWNRTLGQLVCTRMSRVRLGVYHRITEMIFLRGLRDTNAIKSTLLKVYTRPLSCSVPLGAMNETDEFLPLELFPSTAKPQKKVKTKYRVLQPPRMNNMAFDQDWTSVWPVARTFHPEVVPLPIRQGYKCKKSAPPDKWANAELMKIPNFLHLTPPAIKKHCDALRQFCTKWPAELQTEEDCTQHFPLDVITSDYCYSSPTIRDSLARIVNLRVKLSSLRLNDHSRDKLLRLLGSRYDRDTDLITITADRCPTRKQNLEYAYYLLTAVYHESWHTEAWEAEKSIADMEHFVWDESPSRKNVIQLHNWPVPSENFDCEKLPHIEEYKAAIADLMDNGESYRSLTNYKSAVKNLLLLRSTEEDKR
ncbi:hypothetical protein KM043_010478 [Ampulex compressa]|nr:hypothetical protein KM043_010478 [Ampulex compressa]